MKRHIYIKTIIVIIICNLSVLSAWSQCTASIQEGPTINLSPGGETLTKNITVDNSCNGAATFSGVPSWLTINYSVTSKILSLQTGYTTSNRNAQVIFSIPSQNISFTIYISQKSVVTQECVLDGFYFETTYPYSLPTFSGSGGSTNVRARFTGPSTCNETFTFYETPSWITLTNSYGYSSNTSFRIVRIDSQPNYEPSSRSDYIVLLSDSSGTYKHILVNQDMCVDQNWYADDDGDGFGNGPSIAFACSPPYSGAVSNNSDSCPTVYGESNNGCEATNLNWTTSKTYDISGVLKSSSKSYFNNLGLNTQNQTVDHKTNRTWASQTLYDSQGRPALNTLSAPINNTGYFGYYQDIMLNENGDTYLSSDFETDFENPSPVAKTENTLGWYYSEDNTSEPYQDITSYPFSRTIYSKLNPGTVLKTLGGNKINGEWKQDYTFTMIASDELAQSGAFNSTAYNQTNREITKTVTRDVHGVENVVFTDTDGKILAAARSGGNTTRLMTVPIGVQGFVDVHVPAGTLGIGLSGLTTNTQVFNLLTDKLITTPRGTLPNGFYRVSILNLEGYDPSNPVMVTYKENYYDYSLNTYDDVGRLISSKQPLNHLETTYEYNAAGELLSTTSPDEGNANFVYRNDGQIRFSQNSKQKDPNEDGNFSDAEYSYTNYDDLSRPIESGVVRGSFSLSMNGDIANTFSGTRSEQHFTQYDDINTSELTSLPGLNSSYHNPTFLAGNVAKTENNQTTSYYSYDIYGRVKWIVQDILNLGVKTIDYEYDAITSQVNQVVYQKYNTSEKFIHRYTYNPIDYSLTKVETSTNGSSYTTHADYSYYETGALKRTEIAGGIQGIDYVYNLSGQLKAINHPSLTSTNDPGEDTNDLFGMIIDYNEYDYKRPRTNIKSTNYGTDAYNGNIKGIRWNTENATVGVENTYVYNYNRNDWLTQAEYGTFNPDYTSLPPTNEDPVQDDHLISTAIVTPTTVPLNLVANISITLQPGFHAQNGSNFSARIVNLDQTNNAGGFIVNANGDYKVSGIEYDANGNIQSLYRKKNTESGSNRMDELSYTYKTDKPNQLKRVDDAVNIPTNADDIKDQIADNNYIYNAIGQLTENKGEGIKYQYNASGLVTTVTNAFNIPIVKFYYNDKNHRIKKESYSGTTLTSTSYYVRDAAGTPLAIYTKQGGDPIKLVEHTIYGASRLGVHNRQDNTDAYQLTDHLGNVRAVIVKNGTSAAAITGKTDYYPFGMPMPNRNVVGDYRYAFQGQEKDPETGKEAFQLRLWDGRIGRWLTTDPYGQYASPYLGMGNNPISSIDPNGGMSCGGVGEPPCPSTWESILNLFGFGEAQDELTNQMEVTNFTDEELKIREIERTGQSLKKINKELRDLPYNLAPDAVALNLSGTAGAFGGGGGDLDFVWILKGESASIYPYALVGTTPYVSDGFDISLSAGLSFGYQLSDNVHSHEDLIGNSIYSETSGIIGVGGSVYNSYGYGDSFLNPTWNFTGGSIGAGFGASPLSGANVKLGNTTTRFLFGNN